MQQLTNEQAIVLTGFTGIFCCNSFSYFLADFEKRLGYPVFTHQFANPDLKEKIKEAYHQDFMAMIPVG